STATLSALARVAVPHERLSRPQLEARWPQIDFGSIAWAIVEPASGVLFARRAVEAVVRDAVRAGVRYRLAAAAPVVRRGRLDAVTTRKGETIAADDFVFAC